MQINRAVDSGSATPCYSVVLPVYNERGAVEGLVAEIVAALEPLGRSFEILCVDDLSTDGSREVLGALARRDPRVRLVEHRRNCGQSAALYSGFRRAVGDIVITMDADGQNDPADIPAMLARLEPGVHAVTGVRARRRDNWIRRLSSRVGNGFRNVVTGDSIRDAGCAMRVVRREALAEVPAFNGMHRFLPTLLRSQGYTVLEVSVGHRPRMSGTSKYGVGNRLWRGMADCLAMRWWRRRALPGDRLTAVALPAVRESEASPVLAKEGVKPARPREWVALAILALCLLVAYASPLRQWLGRAQEVQAWVQAFGVAAPMVFVGLAALLVAVGFPRTLLFPVAGVMFGFWTGLALGVCGTLAGAYATFYFARWVGRSFVLRKWPHLSRAAERIGRPGMLAIVFIRQLPVPGFLSNLLLGVGSTTHRAFLLGTALGTLPASVVATLVGSSVLLSSSGARVAMAGASLCTLAVLGAFSGTQLMRSDRLGKLRETVEMLREPMAGMQG